jgi:Zn-dependent M28 family amino/carboxypeptidase
MDALLASRNSDSNTLVLFNTAHERMFARVKQYMSGTSRTLDLETATSTVYALTNSSDVTSLEVAVTANVDELPLTNVVGVILGRRTDELVLFGAHHDHLGIRPPVDGDSIANGANDDASGVTAVIELARYFKALRKPTRTLVFVAFAAEEKGLIGSSYFAQQIPPEQVVTLFNIEMIGKVGPYGENAAWITGFDRSDFGEILQAAVEGTGFSFNPEATERTMFFSSDNAPFARLGIPAHSISTTDIEDGDYHQVTDEIETLDLGLMTSTIQAIARAAVPIVNGEATPTRIDIESLN